VEASKDEHFGADSPIDQAVGEPAEDRPAFVAMNHGEGKWILPQSVNQIVRGRKELIAQPRTLTLVPPVRLVKLGRGSRAKETRLKVT
jgi:hypothetical protein